MSRDFDERIHTLPPCGCKWCQSRLKWDHISECLLGEIDFARRKFSSNWALLAALGEELGELSEALVEGKPAHQVFHEAIQVAAVAIRVATEGDAQFSYAPNYDCYAWFPRLKEKP